MNDSSKPKLIVMVGLQGSGKSTIAYELSKKLKIPVFSVDPIHSAILNAGVEDGFAVGYADYLVAERLAEENLRNDISVIVDASNYVKEAHEIWENLAKRAGVKLIVIECRLDREEHKRRLEARVRNMSRIKEVTWEDVEKRMEEMVEWEIEKLVVDTSEPIEDNYKKIIEYISCK